MSNLEKEEIEEEKQTRLFTASQEDCSGQGLIYITGFLCHKLAHKSGYEWMGIRTHEKPTNCNKWISMLSRGGLYMPSDRLMEIVENMETDFNRYHGPSLSLEKNSINILAKVIHFKNPNVPFALIQLYSKTRFFIHMKFLNDEMLVIEKTMRRRSSNHVNKFI